MAMDGPGNAPLAERLRLALAQVQPDSSDFDIDAPAPARTAPARPAGVLLAVTPSERVILTRRAAHLRHHPGQIAFPGGKLDAGDRDAVAAALREAVEEIGLPRRQTQVVGTLSPYRTVSGFAVTPVVALVPAFAPVARPGEVDEVFEVPLAHLLELANYTVGALDWRGSTRHYYAVTWGPYRIWGATAGMLRQLALRMA